MPSRPRRKPQSAGKPASKPASGPTCPSCGAVTVAEALFCHGCGAALAGGRRWSKRTLALLAGIAVAISLGVFALATWTGQRIAAPSAPMTASPPAPVFVPPSGAPSGTPPDLSKMTMRDAADRLFNRIMRASEQGNDEEARRFVPMAVQAYGALSVLDDDAHYHLGLIQGVAGDTEQGRRHIAVLKQAAPNHLLALILEHDIARKAGDSAAAAKIEAAFKAAYVAEMATGRPEYLAHRNTIQLFRDAAPK